MTRPARLLLVLALLLVGGVAQAIEPLSFDNPAQRERFYNLTDQLRCMVCQNENLSNSNAKLAKDMRHRILAMMKSGDSDAEIKHYLVERYSQFVLYKPRVEPGTWALWFGPAIILVLGGIGGLVWLRRRSSKQAVAVVEHDDGDWEENW